MIDPAFTLTLGIVQEVLAIEPVTVERAGRSAQATPRPSARVAVHVAVMQPCRIDQIMTFDGGSKATPA